jgi:hypothetical protein
LRHLSAQLLAAAVGELLVQFGHVAHRAAQEVGFDRARRDGIDGDPAAAQFLAM